MTALLEVRDLRAGFGPNAVLHGVNLVVEEGTVSAVLGLNGAGKSVTMKVVGGLVPAWGGSVLLDGVDITRLSVEQRVALGIAHIPQGRQLFPELTVEENLRLGGYRLRRRDLARYGPVLERLYERFPRLAERRTQVAGTMSGGEQAMLAVARALVSEPRLVLVDEPSAGLAPRVADELFDHLRAVNQAGVTMLLVEQNVRLALRVADRVHVMQRGVVVHEAPVGVLDHDVLAQRLGIGRLLTASVRGSAPSAAVAEPANGSARKATRSARKSPAAAPAKRAAANGAAPAKRAAATKAAPAKRAAKAEPANESARKTARSVRKLPAGGSGGTTKAAKR